MKPMKTFLLRIPESMLNEVASICESQFCTKSSFMRQSIRRNIDVVVHVETPLLRNHRREATVRQLKVLTAISSER